jgi:hypothetical protein
MHYRRVLRFIPTDRQSQQLVPFTSASTGNSPPDRRTSHRHDGGRFDKLHASADLGRREDKPKGTKECQVDAYGQ